ncbi:MAG: hypothetical protein JO112_04555, partial [Planctomycetes bacterium]|nr:hypothetical protein [Planctomycetota bacterium]
DEPTQGKANYHQGGNVAFQADLTPVVKYGQKNLLAIRVYKNPIGVDLDTGDFFFLGGIHRPVKLFSVPETRLEDLTIKTRVPGGGKAQVTVTADVVGPQRANMKVEARLEGLGLMPMAVKAGEPITWDIDQAKYWSAEKPKLYDLHLKLKDPEGNVVEEIRKRVGIREVTIEGGVLKVNHVPVKLAGMCRHENYPTLGTAIGEEVWRRDILLMKAHNVNAIRTSHYPYGSGFYDLCDELGMYVVDEMAACWVPTDQKRLAPHFAQQAREMVRRDRNHPCILIWAIGNENKPGFCNKVAADEIRKLDDTRPRLVSWRRAEEAGVELDDLHYTNPADIRKANNLKRRSRYPITYLENPNDWEVRNGADWGCLDLWGEVIRRTWDVVWEADHVPGSFLWEWADRAVADPNLTKLYDYFPRTGVQLVKIKGQTDGFRNPRPWLYHVKMAYAPVKVELTPRVEKDAVIVRAKNRYSFTDLGEFQTTWQLVHGGKEIQTGRARVALAPRTEGDLRLAIPQEEIARAEALRVTFTTADGRHVATYELPLREPADTGPKLAAAAGVRFPRLNLVTVAYGSSPKTGWRTAFRKTGMLTNIRVAGQAVANDEELYRKELTEVAQVEADVVLATAPKEVVGKVRTEFAHGHFHYRVEWLKEPEEPATEVQELGWIFGVPKEQDRFSWQRIGPLSWYPEDHIGRLRGTTRPDTMDQEITHITRPDAFDFNSTKYACDWATLLDGTGKGLGVRFTREQRHQVRAGRSKEGGYELVVNLHCCPPRDLSSGVVPELYFTLKKGQVTEAAF